MRPLNGADSTGLAERTSPREAARLEFKPISERNWNADSAEFGKPNPGSLGDRQELGHAQQVLDFRVQRNRMESESDQSKSPFVAIQERSVAFFGEIIFTNKTNKSGIKNGNWD